MMTRYSDSASDFLNVTNDGKAGKNNYPITNVATAGIGKSEQDAMDMLLEWNNNDPVDQSETNRNNAVEAFQGNRNPFIDNSNFANLILDSENDIVKKGKINIIYDNTKASVVVNGTKDSGGYYNGAAEIVVTPVNSDTYTGIKDDNLNEVLTISTTYIIPNVTKDYNLTITFSDDSSGSGDSGGSSGSENLGNGETVSVDLANGTYASSIITWTTTEYKYVVSETGEYSNVRIRFDMVLPSSNPTSTSRLYIDDVSIYSIEQQEYYTVKFDSNGGSSISDKNNVLSGSTITALSEPTRDGYTFDGWYYNDDIWNFDTDTVTQNMTLTAQWISNAFLSSVDKLNNVQAYMSLAYKYKYSDVSSVQITDTLTNSLI